MCVLCAAERLPSASISYFPDMFLSTVLIPRRRPKGWIQRQGFGIRKTLILNWIFVSHLLTMAYKSTLLATLIPIRYESSIDNLDDMAKSGLSLLVPGATNIHALIASDPRLSMREIYKKSIVFSYSGGILKDQDKKYGEM